MSFSPETLVGELAATQPGSIRVFQRYGIDFCCGGKRPLQEVCAERVLPYDTLAAELAAAAAPSAPVRLRWDARPLSELTAHIVESFHDPLSVELPRLLAMAQRVDERHGSSSQPHAAAIAATLEVFANGLAAHMRQEEAEVFPLIDRIERDGAGSNEAGRFLAAQDALESEHAEAGQTLATIRALTNDYVPPAGACPTTLGLYHGLRELEALMTLHVHLENNILFPRAQALALAARQGGQS